MKKSLLAALTLSLLASGSVLAAERSGEDVFKAACTVCHTAGVAGAPKLGDKAAWAPRIAKGKEALYTSAIKGIRAMPPKGTCATCTDGELKKAVDYMVSKAK